MTNKKFEPSEKAKAAKAAAMKKKPKPCQHKNLVPIELDFARVTYPKGYAEEPNYDYAASVINATVARVRRFYCPSCQTEIKAPRRKEI